MKASILTIVFLITGIIIFSSPVSAQSVDSMDHSHAEKLIRGFFTGFEKKDWNMVASQLSEGFTFTSPIMMTI